MIMKKWFVGALLTPILMGAAQADSTMDTCILSKMATSDDTVTVGDIRQICSAEINAEKQEAFEPVTLPELKRSEQQTVS
jgi:phospholipase A1